MPAWWVIFGYAVSGLLGFIFILMVVALFRLPQVSTESATYNSNGASSKKSNPLYSASTAFSDKEKLLSGF